MNENQGKKQKEWEDAVKARQRGRAAGWREAESDIKSMKERERDHCLSIRLVCRLPVSMVTSI